MVAIPARLHRPASRLLGTLVCLCALAVCARAQGTLTAQYAIKMTGVTVGEIVWQTEIGDAAYTATASGKASGVLSVLVNGEGAVEARGTIADGRLTPAQFTSTIDDDEGHTELQVSYANGVAKEKLVSGAPPLPDRLPVSDAEHRGVSDPLGAMLIALKAGGKFPAAADCQHVLRIFDGRRRYDLALSYDRADTFKSARGYSGPVLVCGVVLHPIGGYKPGSVLVKYVAGRRDMELWFAPIAGTQMMAPIRVAMPTLVGTLRIEAIQFESVAAPRPPPAPITAEPLPPPQAAPPVQPVVRP